jgi:hypothetical protein
MFKTSESGADQKYKFLSGMGFVTDSRLPVYTTHAYSILCKR